MSRVTHRHRQKTIRVFKDLNYSEVIADPCDVAESYWRRLVGLIGTKHFESGRGLWFPNCKSVHMWFMNIPIDVLFLRTEEVDSKIVYRVTSSSAVVRPWSLFPVSDWNANSVLELPAGTIAKKSIKDGDLLCFD